MNATAMVQTCAARQWPPDAAMYDHLGERHDLDETLRPNLMLLTGPTYECDLDCLIPDEEHAMLLPVLEVRAG